MVRKCNLRRRLLTHGDMTDLVPTIESFFAKFCVLKATRWQALAEN